MIFAATITSGYLHRGPELPSLRTARRWPRTSPAAPSPRPRRSPPSAALRAAFSPIEDVSLFQGIQLIGDSLAGAVLCAGLLRSDLDAA